MPLIEHRAPPYTNKIYTNVQWLLILYVKPEKIHKLAALFYKQRGSNRRKKVAACLHFFCFQKLETGDCGLDTNTELERK